jgi:hypothetical protein
MKIVHFNYAINLKSPFWANDGIFWRYQPDFVIGVFNEVLLVLAAVMVFFIAKKLFDAPVARVAMVLMLGNELLWRFSASGLSTMLLLLIFLALAWEMLKIEELARAEEPDFTQILCWSFAAGILTGIGALTRYAFGWTIIPVTLFLLLFSGPRKLLNFAVAFIAFAIIFAPWIVRNVNISGVPFGTAGYAIFDGTSLAGGISLERSLHPDFVDVIWPAPYWHKLLVGLRGILDNDLFKLGGSWASILFFGGLLLGFNRPGTRRLRYFLLMCLTTFMVVQSLGRTSLSDSSPEVNSENLLVLIVPLVFIFGTAFFFILLDQMTLPAVQLRYVIMGVFIILCCLPMIFLLVLKTPPVRYPPYYPPDIEKLSRWIKEDEMTMSDVPWAVAWYGQRQSVWLTRDDKDDFFAVNDFMKPVSGLYLTPNTMDNGLIDDFHGGDNTWGQFVLNALTRNKIPLEFPLRHAPSGSATISSGMFLTDADRWKLGKDSSE